VKLTTHLHLALMSRMHGAIHPLPKYAFMAWCSVKHRDSFNLVYFYLTSSHYDTSEERVYIPVHGVCIYIFIYLFISLV
jgi:hypothetical protein